MALFNKKASTDAVNEASSKEVTTPKKGKETSATSEFDWVLIRPRITEKAAFLTSDNTYVFDVAPRANKIQIKKAIALQYKVNPVKVNIVHRDTHTDTKRGKKIHVKESKKAIVFLKKGQTIALA
jgi:large subunit ribosomal protein L23